MALSGMLGEAGLTAEKIETHAEVSLEKVGAGFEVTASHLSVVASIPGAEEAKFQEIAERAKSGCPLSKVLRAKITMDARLSTTTA
jgi:osmotically inducible protein OsmC